LEQNQSGGLLNQKIKLAGSLVCGASQIHFMRRASTQAETSQAGRGMQAAKFGHDFGSFKSP
jgi:hypothetical protein